MKVSKRIEDQLNNYNQEIIGGQHYHFYQPTDKVNFIALIESIVTKIVNYERLDNSIHINIQNGWWLQEYLRKILGFKDENDERIWYLEHPIGKLLFSKNDIPISSLHFIEYAILILLQNYKEKETIQFIDFLKNNGFDHSYIIQLAATKGFDFYTYQTENHLIVSKQLNGIGHFLLMPNKENTFSLFKKNNSNNIEEFVTAYTRNSNTNNGQNLNVVVFLNENAANLLLNNAIKFIVYKDYNGFTILDMNVCYYLIENSLEQYKEILQSVLDNDAVKTAHKYELASLLNNKLNNTLLPKCIQLGKRFLEFKISFPNSSKHFYSYYDEYFETNRDKIILVDVFEKLISFNREEAYILLQDYANKAKTLQIAFLQFVVNAFGNEALSILIAALQQNKILGDESYFENLFALIAKYNFQNYKHDVIAFVERITNKKIKVIACTTLATLNEAIVPDAKKLLFGKTIAQRIVGALILSKIKDDAITQLLAEVINTEKNDDTRDVILENLQEQIYGKPFTVDDCKAIITIAALRGKLDKLSEKHIDETALPNINWNNGTVLNIEEKRFLLYRMARSKGLNSDIEARKVIQCIDKNSSSHFSTYLLKCFTNSESNTKYKYYLTLAAMLGGNACITQFDTLFKKAITDKRVKLAEMIVAALAMVGTNKALLSVEAIARKYANKKPAISTAANAALDAAAYELSITKDELGDRIIPNFEFDGIFKELEIDGATYRAYVDKDFTLCYYDEHNKMRKSFPKNISKELKAEFTEINKEIKNVVKAQSGRLEHYLMENRKWTVADWQTYFLQHPIMIVYATQLLWIVYDATGNVMYTIMCQEDGTVVNSADEEIQWNNDETIGLYHPILVSDAENTLWNTKLYDANFVTIFPQTNRNIIKPLADELEKNISERFLHKEIPKGADYVKTFMEKAGWFKTAADGGSIEFSKKFESIGLTIYPNIDGPTAWYQEGKAKATLHQIYFKGKNYNEPFLIKNVPAIIYSEIMGCFQTLIATQ